MIFLIISDKVYLKKINLPIRIKFGGGFYVLEETRI